MRTSLRFGFSLMELIVVMAVIAILSALIVPAITGFGRSTALVTGGNMVTNLTSLARQRAVARSTMTALVMLGEHVNPEDQTGETNFRAFTVLEYTADAGWEQITKWELLPVGIVVDRSKEDSTFLENSPRPFPLILPGQENPPVIYLGRQVTDGKGYAARIFMPSGGLRNPEDSAQLRLVEGFTSGERTTYTHPDDRQKPSNFYDITIIGATGVAKVSRP